MGIAALAALGWQLTTRPPAAPPSPLALAREGLPHLLDRVKAEPHSVEARVDLSACYTLLGDRLGAWQQLGVAESLGGSSAAVQRMRARAAEALGLFEEAAGAAERAWRATPGDLRRGLELHRLLTLQANFARAHTIARDVLARQPSDPEALAAAGEAAFNLARYPEAIRQLGAARAAAPERPELAVKLGLALIRADRGQEAVQVLSEAVQAPAPPQAWEFLGQAQLSMGRTEAAENSFRKAEEAGALGGSAAFGQALVALAQGRPEVAEPSLVRALEQDPAHAAAAVTLAQFLRSGGRRAEAAAVRGRAALAVSETAEAVAAFREAAAVDTRNMKRWRELARALQAAEDGPGALAALRRAQALAPNDADLAAQQIETALAVFSPQEALRGCRRYAALAPTATTDTEWWRFRAYRQLQDTSRARAALQAAAAAGPDRPEFLTWQGRTLLEEAPDAEQVATAERYLRRALDLRPTDVEILGPLAEVCMRQKRWEEAATLLRRALAIDPDWGAGPLWLQLERADRALGRVHEAKWDIERHRRSVALRTEVTRLRAEAAAHPREGARRAAWAQAALRAGRLTEARAAARSAIRLAPSDPRGYRALAAACQRLGRLEDRIVAMEAAASVRRNP